jgi:hypothetical protein
MLAEPRSRWGTVVLVEGFSDLCALEALAARGGRDLYRERVSIVPMGGATNIGHFLDAFGPRGLGARRPGLCDAAAEPDFGRGLQRAGLGTRLARGGLEGLGFFVCLADLEDELIRALGVASVGRVIEGQGELGSLRTLQQQPAHRGEPAVAHRRRFMGTRSGRKRRYARLLAEAVDPARVPRPLQRLLAHA